MMRTIGLRNQRSTAASSGSSDHCLTDPQVSRNSCAATVFAEGEGLHGSLAGSRDRSPSSPETFASVVSKTSMQTRADLRERRDAGSRAHGWPTAVGSGATGRAIDQFCDEVEVVGGEVGAAGAVDALQ